MDLHILGTRGVPARHGGFETFAENLSICLASRGHRVTVYCQLGPDEAPFTDEWKGVTRVGLPHRHGALGTILFDLQSSLIASRRTSATVLTLGYNTAVFSLIHRFRGVRHVMNMDGMEWQRQKWNTAQKIWLWLNEWCGLHLSDRLVADHPHIQRILAKKIDQRKIAVIPYGAAPVDTAEEELVRGFGLVPRQYCLVIARPEPENSILEIVKAYRAQPRSYRLVILGRYVPNESAYHAEVVRLAADPDILFLGAIHDPAVVAALRFHALLYVHGHQVGGTNPSLVESLAAGNAVIAHDNQFNRWVAGWAAAYFGSIEDLVSLLDELPPDRERLEKMRAGSRRQHQRLFRQESIMQAYEDLLQFDELTPQHWELVRPTELVPHATPVNSIEEPCPGYFSSAVTEILWREGLANGGKQPCARCGREVSARRLNGCWIPSMHWRISEQDWDHTASA